MVSERAAKANRISVQPERNGLEAGAKRAGITAESVRDAVLGWMVSIGDVNLALRYAADTIVAGAGIDEDRARRLVRLAYLGS